MEKALLGGAALPTEQPLLTDSSVGTTEGTVGPLLDLVGSTVDQLEVTATWGPVAPGLAGSGCAQIERATGDGRTTLFLLDGTVVAQRYVSIYGEGVGLPEAGASSSDGRFEKVQGVLLRRATARFEVVDAPSDGGVEAAVASSGRYQHVAQIVPELDTAVVVVPPVLLEQKTGGTCG